MSTCGQCGTDLAHIPADQIQLQNGTSFCSIGCLMGATTPTGNSSGIDPSLIAPEDPTR